jgi:WD40 repeat protein
MLEPDPLPSIKTPWRDATPSSGAGAGDVPPIPVPDHILIRRIGRGAYGEVWLARNALGNWRAVKFVRRSSFDDDRPFEREFAGIQRFEPISRSHESQLNILHVGRAEDGFYYVMELADDMGRGQEIHQATYTPRNLRSELHLRGRLPAAECLRIGLALTTALEHLHKHGLVHRDIKPSNIVFVNGIPKLADIGLVARAEATISFVGTEGFLPPEGPGTRQADIYSLGKVLYEIGTGHDRNQFPELPTNIVELPDRAELSELNEVLLKACHRDPKERYQTAAEMHAELALLQSGRSVVRLRGIERRLRFAQRAGAVVTAIAALVAGLYFWQARQTRIVRELAAEKTRLGEENRQRIVRLDVANGVRVLDEGDPAGALLWFADALSLVTNNPAEESVHRIRFQQTLDHSPRLVSVFPHPANVQCAVFSPDEKQIATACEDGFVRIWNAAQSGKPLAEFRQPEPPRLLRYTRDGRRLLVITAPALLRFAPPLGLTVLDAAAGAAVFPTLTNLTAWAASPDDQWLAVAGEDFKVQIHELATGRLAGTAAGHQDTVSEINFSPDSAQIITASFDRTARRWEVPSGKPVGSPLRHDSALVHAVFSPDGRQVATATAALGPGQRIEFLAWDAATSAPLGKPTKAEETILLLAFDGTGRRLLAGDRQHIVQVRDAASGEALPSLKLTSYVCSFDRVTSDSRVAVGTDDGTVSVWDPEIGRSLCSPLFHQARAESVQFDQAGKRLLTASGDGTVKLWNLVLPSAAGTVRLDSEFPIVDPGSIRPSFGKEPGPIQIPLMDGTVHLIDLDRMQEVHRLAPSQTNNPAYFCDASPSGRQWVVYRIWSAEFWDKPQALDLFCQEGTAIRHLVLNHPKYAAGTRSFSPDSSRLLTTCRDRTIRVWRTTDGGLDRTIQIPEPFTDATYFSPDAKSALLVQEDGTYQWFDLESERTSGTAFHPPPVSNMEFDPTGQRIAITGKDQSTRIWNTRTGEPLTPPFKHAGTALNLDWSPDGRRLVTAGLSSEARIWDATTGEQLLAPLALSTEPTRAARWSSDGRFIVTRSDDNLVRVWDAATAEAITPKLRQENFVRLACLRENNRLILGIDPNLVLAWDLNETRLPADVIADYAKLVSGRRLNAAGLLLPLKPEELAGLCRSLRSRAPQLFE